jgi:hypothetical protein
VVWERNKPGIFGERKQMLNANFVDLGDVVWDDA